MEPESSRARNATANPRAGSEELTWTAGSLWSKPLQLLKKASGLECARPLTNLFCVPAPSVVDVLLTAIQFFSTFTFQFCFRLLLSLSVHMVTSTYLWLNNKNILICHIENSKILGQSFWQPGASWACLSEAFWNPTIHFPPSDISGGKAVQCDQPNQSFVHLCKYEIKGWQRILEIQRLSHFVAWATQCVCFELC